MKGKWYLVVQENEELFFDLHLGHFDMDYANELIKEGYLDQKLRKTKKADNFLKQFYKSRSGNRANLNVKNKFNLSIHVQKMHHLYR